MAHAFPRDRELLEMVFASSLQNARVFLMAGLPELDVLVVHGNRTVRWRRTELILSSSSGSLPMYPSSVMAKDIRHVATAVVNVSVPQILKNRLDNGLSVSIHLKRKTTR